MDSRYKLTAYIKDVDTVPRSDSAETLGTVLSLVQGSHSAIFLYNKREKFIGLISPYKTLYKQRFPRTTKASSVVFQPPHITPDTPLYRVARLMLASRIYTLPVFDGKKQVVGVVSAKDILRGVLDDPLFLTYVARLVGPRKPVTLPLSATVREAYSLFRDRHISRVLLLDTEGKLAGIVAQADIKDAFTKPVPRDRFSKKSGDVGYFAFDEEEKYRQDAPLRKYMTDRVRTVNNKADMQTVVRKLLSSDKNSIVLTTGENIPSGFLSTRDILEAVASVAPEAEIPILMKNPHRVSEAETAQIQEILDGFITKLNKRLPLAKVALRFEEPSYQDGKAAVFNASLIVTPVKGEELVAKVKAKVLLDGFHEALREIERQERGRERKPEHTPIYS